jgi:type VII secretion integral membrane protein EccD
MDTASPVSPAQTATAPPARPAVIAGPDTCRLTVIGPDKRVDLSVPVTVAVGELLPMLLRHATAEGDREQPWVLQRLGGEPFEPESTAETLDLRHGEVLYLRPRQHALPALEFDDVAVGVANLVSGRYDRWRPDFSARLLTGAACLALAAFAATALGLRPGIWITVSFGGAALVLAAACLLAIHLAGDRAASLVAGLSACVFAGIAGLASFRGLAGVIAPGRDAALAAGVGAGLVAATLLAAGARPVTAYGALLAAAVAAAAGAWVALAAHWPAAWAAAVLAVAMFVASARSLRIVLRAARLRAPQLPGTAEELQEDIDPEPEETLARRTATAVTYLDSLTIGSALVFAVALAWLTRSSQWADLTLAAALSGAVLLRARRLIGLWQRMPLVIAGAIGLALVLESVAAGSGLVVRGVILAVFAAGGLLLLVAARWLPGRRLLPVWAQLAGQLETVTAIALVPLLLQVLHVYSHLRSLVS